MPKVIDKAYTLVVVDMQSCFDAANNLDAIVGCTAEIIRAKETNSNILFVEYGIGSSTHPALRSIVKKYPRVAKVTKNHDDGSVEVMRTIRRKGWNHKTIRVCGVNTDCCVWATVDGLLSRAIGSKIEVAKNACATAYHVKYDWRNYIRHENLKLV